MLCPEHNIDLMLCTEKEMVIMLCSGHKIGLILDLWATASFMSIKRLFNNKNFLKILMRSKINSISLQTTNQNRI
jgi:hypothetical protein